MAAGALCLLSHRLPGMLAGTPASLQQGGPAGDPPAVCPWGDYFISGLPEAGPGPLEFLGLDTEPSPHTGGAGWECLPTPKGAGSTGPLEGGAGTGFAGPALPLCILPPRAPSGCDGHRAAGGGAARHCRRVSSRPPSCLWHTLFCTDTDSSPYRLSDSVPPRGPRADMRMLSAGWGRGLASRPSSGRSGRGQAGQPGAPAPDAAATEHRLLSPCPAGPAHGGVALPTRCRPQSCPGGHRPARSSCPRPVCSPTHSGAFSCLPRVTPSKCPSWE